MTYQELLEEFDNRRSLALEESGLDEVHSNIESLQWAIQSILEKLRDEENLLEETAK